MTQELKQTSKRELTLEEEIAELFDLIFKEMERTTAMAIVLSTGTGLSDLFDSAFIAGAWAYKHHLEHPEWKYAEEEETGVDLHEIRKGPEFQA